MGNNCAGFTIKNGVGDIYAKKSICNIHTKAYPTTNIPVIQDSHSTMFTKNVQSYSGSPSDKTTGNKNARFQGCVLSPFPPNSYSI